MNRTRELERALAGMVMLDHSIMGYIDGLLAPEDFQDVLSKEVFRNAKSAFDKSETFDLLVAVDSIKNSDAAALAAMTDAVPSASTAKDYAKRIRLAASERRLAAETRKIISSALPQLEKIARLEQICGYEKSKIEGTSKGNDSSTFGFTPLSQYLADELEPPRWLIQNILEAETLAVLFGSPESYKSFVVLDMALSIAAGRDWHGHKVTAGPVFSIIGEGANGYRRRVAAWMKIAKVPADIPFFISETPAQILDVESAKKVGAAINALREKHGSPSLVVIDTLAHNFGPGHENDTRDMTQFVANLDEYIGRDFSRLIVHHSGLGDQGRARGNSSLRAALDAEMCVKSEGDGIIFSCTKMKDAPRFRTISFAPEVINLGGPPKNPITSVVLRRAGALLPPAKLKIQWREALLTLREMSKKSVRFCFRTGARKLRHKKSIRGVLLIQRRTPFRTKVISRLQVIT